MKLKVRLTLFCSRAECEERTSGSFCTTLKLCTGLRSGRSVTRFWFFWSTQIRIGLATESNFAIGSVDSEDAHIQFLADFDECFGIFDLLVRKF